MPTSTAPSAPAATVQPEPEAQPPAQPAAQPAAQPGIYLAPSLESIVQDRLRALAEKIPKTMAPEGNAPMQEVRLLNDIGEYLTLSAKVWADLSIELAHNRPIQKAIIQAHEISRQKTRFADLTTVVALDSEQKKLLQIRDLTRKYSDDVKRVWENTRDE